MEYTPSSALHNSYSVNPNYSSSPTPGYTSPVAVHPSTAISKTLAQVPRDDIPPSLLPADVLTEDKIHEASLEKSPDKVKKVQVRIKPAKKQVKTLREEQVFNDMKFKENILIVNDEGSVHYSCKLCKTKIEFVRKARSHASKCETRKKQKKKIIKKSYHCTSDNCDKIFTKKKVLVMHFKEFHQSASYSCSICDRKFKDRCNYKRHVMLHRERPAVQCKDCAKFFTNNGNLKRHIKENHSSYSLAKEILVELLIKIMTRENIEASGSEEMPGKEVEHISQGNEFEMPGREVEHICPGNEFEEEGRFLIPESGPRGEHFVCDECGKRFGNRSNLNRHVKSLHKSQETVCPHPFCQKIFSDKFMMMKHKSFCFMKCPWEDCSLKFTRPTLFKQHQKAHESRMRRLI